MKIAFCEIKFLLTETKIMKLTGYQNFQSKDLVQF